MLEYNLALASRMPTPGGGSAAALSAALGASLIAKVANYSLGKGRPHPIEKKIKTTLQKIEKIRDHLLECVDLDAQAYQAVVDARKKGTSVMKKALKQAQAVPRKVCLLSYQALELAPVLVEHGNKYLLSDIEVALELLSAAHQSALINVKVNQLS